MASFSSTLSLSVVLFLVGIVSAQLSPEYYYLISCPPALSIIKSEVINAMANDERMGASLLRLHFHDCFVNGCDASILLDDKLPGFIGEKTAFPNANSVRGYEVIDSIKAKLEFLCPRKVSCADILAVAARDSVVALGHGLVPGWSVTLGRRDSLTANLTAANTDLPSPFLDLDGLISAFAKKNFNTQEMVVLSGAHTIGKARCTTFRTRLYNENNIDSNFANSMKNNCPSADDDNNLSPLDETTTVFDNAYFRDLKELKGLLHSDQQLYNNGSTDSLVKDYYYDSSKFFTDFGNAMIKMGNLSPLIAPNGEIRTHCSMVNGS